MKKSAMLLMLLLAMAMKCHHVFAQSVTITLLPGWNWISCPMMDTLDFETALGSFTPATGDIIQSRWSLATYANGQWRGTISQFYPGYGYMYKSNRSMPVFLTFNVQQPAPQVVVYTSDPTDITAIAATCGGEVVSNDGTYIIVKGICWATHPTPTSNDNYLEFGSGEGSFTTTWTDLEINTTYYVRAYAVTPNGTVYGAQQVFTTKDGIPVLTTMDVSDIGRGSASCGGNLMDEGGFSVTARGVCWSTSPNPTISDSHTSDGVEIGSFTSSITRLSANTIYHVRSYATNSFTTGYGEEKIFTTLEQTWNNGISPGVFSVSSTQQVYFSQGNLQYIGSADMPYWKFAEYQWEYLCTATGQGSECENVDRDLFGWATSGYNHGAYYYQPWNTYGYSGFFGEGDGDDYYLAYGGQYNLYDQTGMADWGYNAISNGGNQESMWYTLSQSEWDYLINTRNTNSGIRYAKANVGGVNGMILLPDDWDVSTYLLIDPNGGEYDSNTISVEDWMNTLEVAGAVFLPAAGTRWEDHSLNDCGSYGNYWSATFHDGGPVYIDNDDPWGKEMVYVGWEYYANTLSFRSTFTSSSSSIYDFLFCGNSVRLVSPIQPIVKITGVSDITETTAVCGGRIVNSIVNPVTECGFCWGTEPSPTINNNIIIANGGTTGAFTLELTNLIPNTKYYVRAFATNSMGTFYGSEVSFTCRNFPTGTVNGLFSVNSNSQVYFSQGNLQYQASTNTWKFAENQYDCVGSDNGHISSSYSGWIDLFGWGTSSYNHGANCYQPWSTSPTYSDYYAYGSNTYNLYDQTGQADWGYNTISNGGNTTDVWHTLTKSEWSYIFNTRTTASGIRYAKAKVYNVNGVILLPDDWSPTTYSLSNTNSSGASFNSNVINAGQWSTLENAGAVFLPAAGDRNGNDVINIGSRGFYWSSSCNNNSKAHNVLIKEGSLSTNDSNGKYYGFSVRLVRVAE